ncbi:hypothetical protein KVG88_13740 [Pseudomonas sp. SWRI74]|uniref:Uncharacterized protein n=1 Tax=Pseudomonas azerbaijanoccidentalis TaxID=2842347 RepID=A0ABS6QRH3_9PSED|nr:hypothetical protein [Pseudomonas azerbaijanoccidentalis]MBV4521127.1 hypothetical protein [Pseudomonas azerbaijanoccidentalis]
MQNLKRKVALRALAGRGSGESAVRQRRAQKSEKHGDFRSFIRDLMWIPSSPEHMLIL